MWTYTSQKMLYHIFFKAGTYFTMAQENKFREEKAKGTFGNVWQWICFDCKKTKEFDI